MTDQDHTGYLTDETIKEWLHPTVREPLTAPAWMMRTRQRLHTLGNTLLVERLLNQEVLEELEVALADNAAHIESMEFYRVALNCLHNDHSRECRAETVQIAYDHGETLRAQPHPGAALLERVARMEAVVDEARQVCDGHPSETRLLQELIELLDAEPGS